MKQREQIRVARECGRPVVAVRFEVPAVELLERNETRDQVLQDKLAVTMAAEMEEHSDLETLVTEVDVVLDAEDVRRRLSPR